jgi:hypothetical protein
MKEMSKMNNMYHEDLQIPTENDLFLIATRSIEQPRSKVPVSSARPRAKAICSAGLLTDFFTGVARTQRTTQVDV